MGRAVADCDGDRCAPDLQHNIEQKRAVGVEHDSGTAVGLEAGVVDFENIAADGKDRESVGAAAIGQWQIAGRRYWC